MQIEENLSVALLPSAIRLAPKLHYSILDNMLIEVIMCEIQFEMAY